MPHLNRSGIAVGGSFLLRLREVQEHLLRNPANEDVRFVVGMIAPVVVLGGQHADRDGPALEVQDARVGIAENAGGFAKDDTAAVAVTIVSNEPAD